ATSLTSTSIIDSIFRNFYLESSIVTQRFDKPNYGIAAPALVCNPHANEPNNYLGLFWNYTPGDTTPVQLTPVSYELEWTYADDYDFSLSSGTSGLLPASAVNYSFKNNATRVWLDTNYYRIPLVYNSGYVVYRVRAVRPDSTQFRYNVYGPWSMAAESGVISSLSSNDYHHLSSAYSGDSLNWQYTVAFAEGGKYKHVMSFYDGLLKNRQSVTRFNTDPNKLIVTQNIYDFEGRNAIKTLPTPVSSGTFKYRHNVALNAVTGFPFEADNFDTGFNLCPYLPRISPLSSTSLANIYYSSNNPDTTGVQRFVPDAEGYPFLHTIYRSTPDNKVQYQGGAGHRLQPGDSNCFQFFYAVPNQQELNRLFGQNVGWKSYYTATISMDPNQQLSTSIKDYEGKQVMTALIGPGPNPGTHALTPVDVPAPFNLKEDLLYGQTQTVVDHTKTADFEFFNQAIGPDSIQYSFSYNPYPLCPGQSLGVKARYHYEVVDQCGDIVVSQDTTIGANGLITSPVSFTGNLEVFSAGVAPYHVHKELLVDPVDFQAALDSFFLAPPSCFLGEPAFLRRAVTAREFPCPEENVSPCESKKWLMMQELFPGAKYGKFTVALPGPIIDDTNSIFTIFPVGEYHRYQDTCTVPSLADTITVGGIFYNNLRTMSTDLFIWVYNKAISEGNYSIAEALLPLHPEYCQLKECFNDTFLVQISAIPDHKIAERLDRLYLDSIIAHDPFVGVMNSFLGISSAADSLRTFRGGQIRLDSFILSRAYCSCTDSVMGKRCLTDMYGYEIANGILLGDRVKKQYFDEVVDLYFTNRDRFLEVVTMGRGDSCSHCALKRMNLVPDPIFDHLTTPSGTVAVDSLHPYGAFPGSFDLSWIGTISPPDSMDSMMLAIYDSATALYASIDSSLCYGQIDTILSRLSNCIAGDTTVFAAMRSTFDSLCAAHAMVNGNYTPEQIRFVLVRNGRSLDDLCNPYVVSYMDFPGTAVLSQNCKKDTFYRSATLFLDDTVVTVAFNSPGTAVFDTLHPTSNLFEKDIYDALGGNVYTKMFATYDTGDKLLTLMVFNDPSVSGVSLTDTVKVFLRSPGLGNVFGLVADSFNVSVACVNSVPQIETSGLVNEFSFVANVTAYTTSTALTTAMLGWTDSVQSMNNVVNPLASCVPCTRIRELYERFADTLSAYQVKGVDHPYYEQMLTSFMDYELGQYYSTDQYLTFIESCALADSMKMPLYFGYATYKFAGSAEMNSFMTSLAAIDTDYSFNSSTYRDSAASGTITVCVGLNHIIPTDLWKYKTFLNTYTGSYTSRIVNVPYSTLLPSNSLGVLYTPTVYPFSPADSSITSLADSLTYTSYSKGVWVSDHFEPATFYDIVSTATAPSYRISKNAYEFSMYLYNHGIPYVSFIPNFQSTINDDYFLTEKQDYLHYTYGFQGLPSYEVLDSIQSGRLLANIPSYSGYQASYEGLFASNNFNNLYLSGPSMVNTYYDTLLYILQSVSDSNTVSPGHIFLNAPRSVVLSAHDSQLIAYRCSDHTYWYRYFGYGDTLYNVHVAIPAYIPLYEHHLYTVLSVSPALGDSLTRQFTLRIKKPGDTTVITAKGLTSFVIGKNIELHNVLLGGQMLSSAKEPPLDTFDNCERSRLADGLARGHSDYNAYLDSMVKAITAGFGRYLMDSIKEQLILTYINNAFGITLYHYDRAGNLTGTVPPMGVAPLASGLLHGIDTARLMNVPGLDAPYSKQNSYTYNSLNQVIHQKTINGGATDFFYDDAGRLIFSQNDKQAPAHRYTYNFYDPQGRLIETGDVQLLAGPFSSGTPHSSIIAAIKVMNRQDVVRTVYDDEIINLKTVANIDRQENLRKRVAVVQYFDSVNFWDTTYSEYTYATHYSYDPSGNVKTLTHDFPELASIRQQFKRIDYDYDLISGKVNMLSYNRAHPDQFYQRYYYDADNRITQVQTSNDGYIWVNDASYTYYQHGPLARVVLGKLMVQGMDFAYTIQGWLKAVNGDTLGIDMDMSKDGELGVSVLCNDALAHTIDYFKGDYNPIATWKMQHIPEQDLNLYNGNIARQTVAMANYLHNPNFHTPLHKQYIYDQFNRIKDANYYRVNASAETITWMKDFYNSYKYDQDGNILELVRYNTRAIGPPVMDSLIYKYSAGTSVNDLLDDVYDCNDDAYDRDIHAHCPGSSPSRYTYDPVGNTTSDMVNAQDNIEWNIYNKVTKTENTTDTNKMFFQYNGMGNRVSKTFVGNIPNGSRKTTDYYYHDAQGNILATYKGLVESDTAGTVHKVGFSLASHDLYGGARLGTKEYGLKNIGMEVTIGLEPTDSLVDTMRLAKHVPWYSLEYQDDIHPDSLVPYDNHWKDSAYAWHRMGEKHYELSDHLGNVNVVISDARRVRTFDTIPGYPPYAGNYPIEVTSYKPERVASFDYYPFGMMMPERHMIDTTTLYRSGPITLDHFPVHRWYPISTKVFGSGCAPCAIDTMGTTRLSFATTGVTVIDTYRVSTSSAPIPDDLLYGNWNIRYRVGGMHPWRKNRIRIYINGLTQPTASHFWLDLYHTDYSTHLYSLPIGVVYGAPAIITATVQPTSLTAIDTAVIFSLGWKRMADTTTPHPPYDYSITIDSIVVDYDTIVQLHNIVAGVSGSDGYGYGHNGQMKVNEIAGIGNHYTAQYWEMDPRVGRRWNLDPKPMFGLSEYSLFNNNPIWYSDILGDKFKNGEQENKDNAEKDKNDAAQRQAEAQKKYDDLSKTYAPPRRNDQDLLRGETGRHWQRASAGAFYCAPCACRPRVCHVGRITPSLAPREGRR
ncbi:MAG: hypothetical protein IAE95_10060, partial [Chitinophagaceae bacterium]|nr:hypothetical protein [Chitinophagaceae bacterium]